MYMRRNEEKIAKEKTRPSKVVKKKEQEIGS